MRRVGLSNTREHTGDRATDEIWEKIRLLNNAVNALRGASGSDDDDQASMLLGQLIDAEEGESAGTGLAFTAGEIRSIEHGLGRTALGFFELASPDLPTPAHVGLFSVDHPTGTTSATHITVQAQATGSCLLWVF